MGPWTQPPMVTRLRTRGFTERTYWYHHRHSVHPLVQESKDPSVVPFPVPLSSSPYWEIQGLLHPITTTTDTIPHQGLWGSVWRKLERTRDIVVVMSWYFSPFRVDTSDTTITSASTLSKGVCPSEDRVNKVRDHCLSLLHTSPSSRSKRQVLRFVSPVRRSLSPKTRRERYDSCLKHDDDSSPSEEFRDLSLESPRLFVHDMVRGNPRTGLSHFDRWVKEEEDMESRKGS